MSPQAILRVVLLATLMTIPVILCASLRDYHVEREEYLAEESKRVLGSGLELNEKEELVNKIVLDAKRREFEKGLSETFPPSVNFLTHKHLVEQSEVFDIIRRMPKGRTLPVIFPIYLIPRYNAVT